jgi:hypothetical protein
MIGHRLQNAAMKFDQAPLYPSTRSPIFGRNVVATSHPLAAAVRKQHLHRAHILCPPLDQCCFRASH